MFTQKRNHFPHSVKFYLKLRIFLIYKWQLCNKRVIDFIIVVMSSWSFRHVRQDRLNIFSSKLVSRTDGTKIWKWKSEAVHWGKGKGRSEDGGNGKPEEPLPHRQKQANHSICKLAIKTHANNNFCRHGLFRLFLTLKQIKPPLLGFGFFSTRWSDWTSSFLFLKIWYCYQKRNLPE